MRCPVCGSTAVGNDQNARRRATVGFAVSVANNAYPRAIRIERGKHLRHRKDQCRKNRLERDRRGNKNRCLASRAPYQQDDIAEGTTDAETLSAAGPERDDMFRRRRTDFRYMHRTAIALGIREAA